VTTKNIVPIDSVGIFTMAFAGPRYAYISVDRFFGGNNPHRALELIQRRVAKTQMSAENYTFCSNLALALNEKMYVFFSAPLAILL
jgi:hypothetical protein